MLNASEIRVDDKKKNKLQKYEKKKSGGETHNWNRHHLMCSDMTNVFCCKELQQQQQQQ